MFLKLIFNELYHILINRYKFFTLFYNFNLLGYFKILIYIYNLIFYFVPENKNSNSIAIVNY